MTSLIRSGFIQMNLFKVCCRNSSSDYIDKNGVHTICCWIWKFWCPRCNSCYILVWVPILSSIGMYHPSFSPLIDHLLTSISGGRGLNFLCKQNIIRSQASRIAWVVGFTPGRARRDHTRRTDTPFFFKVLNKTYISDGVCAPTFHSRGL